MMCAKVGTIVMANNVLARGCGTYETPYTMEQSIIVIVIVLLHVFVVVDQVFFV